VALLVFTLEKTREVNDVVARELLEVAARERKPTGFKAALVAYGVTALPLVDPTTRWEILPIAYQETPVLGKSPNIARALREVIELVESIENPWEPVQVIVVWSAAVRPGKEADIALKCLEALGAKVDIVMTRPSPPGWIKYNPAIAEKITPVRANTNIEKLYERLVQP
jgi:hypothetical protein